MAEAESAYRSVAREKLAEMWRALRDAAGNDGRFRGTPEEQGALADQMADLFSPLTSGGFGADPVDLKRSEVLGLAGDLRSAQSRFSPGQYAAELETLLKP